MTTTTTQGLPPLIAIVGTNASGKSDLAITLAEQFSGEIVSADSRQVYEGMPLASGKPSAEDLARVPHHLLDIVPIDTIFSLADFQRYAYREIDQISARGKLPFLVGGTGLYTRAVIDGYDLTGAQPDRELRERLERYSDDELWQNLRERSPSAATLIDPRNRRRLIRALEITEAGYDYKVLHANKPRYHVLQLGLTWPRDELRIRIMARLRRRLDAGMIAETEDAIRRGISHERLEALGLEYRYISRYLLGAYPDYETFVTELGRAIYRFAMRQKSWFRHDISVVWLDASGDYFQEAVGKINEFLAKTRSYYPPAPRL